MIIKLYVNSEEFSMYHTRNSKTLIATSTPDNTIHRSVADLKIEVDSEKSNLAYSGNGIFVINRN